MAYSNYFNFESCSVGCNDCKNTYANYGCTNYSNHGDHSDCAKACLVAWWHVNSYGESNSGYTDHRDCTNIYANHFDRSSGVTTTASYSIGGIDSHSTDDWIKLKDAIDDLKKLRNAVADMPNHKVDAAGQTFTMYFAGDANSDDKFAPGQTPKAAQFNETLGNVKRLWEKIWGNPGSGWPAEVQRGDQMKKDDYQTLFNKVDSLARHDQSNFYTNHYDRSKT